MSQPRTSRRGVPSAASLGLSRPHAAADLAALGWDDEAHLDLLWTLAATGHPDQALNNIVRLIQATEGSEVPAAASATELQARLDTDHEFRVRLLALLGASSLLGDHVVAHPEIWPQLGDDLPGRVEMMDTMLASVDAASVDGQDADGNPLHTGDSLLRRAGMTGPAADRAMRTAYRTLLARIAAIDLAGTFVPRRGEAPTAKGRTGYPDFVPFEVIADRLADAADAALSAALAVATAVVYPSGPVDARIAVLAMGKCGALELNYISDVDVIFVAEPADARTTRLAGEFINIGCRCFFEVDAALRPEGKHGALVRTLDSHLAYYRKWAHTWEFQALLKARPMTGDLALGEAYVEELAPMVWTASQREDFVPDVQAMRRRVVDNVPEDLQARELKLGPGGLRDVEFAVQLLQMVHGRADVSLRVRSTVDALNALVAGGYVSREDGRTLIGNYSFMRLLEHRMQLHHLRRTHLLPEDSDLPERTWLARVSGLVAEGTRTLAEELEAQVRSTGRQIRQLHNKLFYRPLLSSVVAMSVDELRLTPEAAQRQLAALGYRYPDRAMDHLTALASDTTRRARVQAVLLPSLLEWLSETVDPDAGLLAYRKLSEAAVDRAWFLRLLRDENIVGQRLMKILGTSPYVTDLFLAAPDAVKMLSDGAMKPKLLEKSASVISHSLVAAAGRHTDPDKAISVARSLRRTELARVAAADLLGMMDLPEVAQSLSLVWDAVLEAALSAEIRAWEDAHSRNAPAVISVIGMGRLGGAELSYRSDADVLFVCEPVAGDGIEGMDIDRDGEPGTDQDAVAWAIGICDRLRSRLAKPSQDPPLEVDLDLRPEGRSGPAVRTLESYRAYYERWGETWEYQALLRATWVAGDKDLGIRFLRSIDPFRYPEGGADEKTVQEVRRMKARVDGERLPRGANRATHTKLGRGGLADVEWTVQLLTMQHSHLFESLHNTSTLEVLEEIRTAGLLSEFDVETLREAWITASHARNALVLSNAKTTDQLPPPGAQLVHVAAAAGWDPEDSQGYLDDYLKKTRRARRVVDRVFWGEEVVDARYDD
ncbi:bifunctional [glutamine synthetase] adenylyltransferase/[glutamine synthetase]-adenylyl-L-tyrosine phosphorylase [Corynebacterium terpenotabidum]|uniref:Bifunctional glutamine-synthetase adenylyltransferase/deadenyltransferase n=1 Tax=Corynebacterium terpenotabidum Y-11 TaxID=1200352 RepID=S4XIU7_9CORY|nr:bifunctional [glutamine synthetase] adenylyltransferase/[glutamine synthetase]-adenylyl-L-tyrosine phosphorylase [Corynebacterium terpenotabidum]AGP30518.1 bifunctional glutamine-synthetase adenylyltransferase/deadenyltransferase [Corynebacterium terpenotabidum Y-11]